MRIGYSGFPRAIAAFLPRGATLSASPETSPRFEPKGSVWLPDQTGMARTVQPKGYKPMSQDLLPTVMQ